MKRSKKFSLPKRGQNFILHPSSFSLQKGFTLLELIVVISIISLFVALAFPAFYGLEERGLKSDARKTASLLRYLHENAIASKKTFSLQIDLSEHALSWNGPEGNKNEELSSLADIYLQSKGNVKEGQVIVFFGSSGIQEPIEVRLRAKDKTMTVSFSPISGRAKIKDEL
ncbi:MAG: prepilin-type N-terminal cleavage/methylation domain-containing protein [Nitrospirae bacterium]|nr:prepilin-type N-terminal cleavage/methylation domain-containing protein [Nitrospirota bacterium]